MKYIYRHKQFTAEFTDEDGYFSLTGDVGGGSGACGDEIAKIDGRFRLMNSMHLCDCKTGKPMHAEANAMYFAEEYNKTGGKEYSLETITNHLHVSVNKAKEFCELVKDGIKFNLNGFFDEMRIQWAQEAEDVVDQAQKVYDEYLDENEADDDGPFDFELCDEPAKVKALSEWLECDPSDITEEDSNRFGAHGRDYLVVDDDEADELWDESLESYIDECIEIPENMKFYFDRDRWKKDARVDGRGHSLGRYDGNENDVTVEYDGSKETYYIYRQ